MASRPDLGGMPMKTSTSDVNRESRMMLDDHERRRRMATSAIGDMVCQMWPAQAWLRDEGNRLDELQAAYRNATSEHERDRLSNAVCESLERMGRLVDLIAEQL